jgi:hypothetical protein
MIEFKKEAEGYSLLIGYDYASQSPKRVIPVTAAEAEQIASYFTEDFALAVGNKEKEWSFGSFKLTDAPDHPYGWTDSRKRTILHFKNLNWHMIAPEIAKIGDMARQILQSDE